MRFRLFDRVRRTREPEPGHAGAVRELARRSGRHRFGSALDRQRRAAGPAGNADRRGNGPDLRGVIAWRAQPAGPDTRGRAGAADPPGKPRAADPPGLGRAWDPAAVADEPDRRGGPAGGDGWPDGAARGTRGGGERDGANLWRQAGPDAAKNDPGADSARPYLPRRPGPPWDAGPGGARARIRESLHGGEPFTSPVRDKVTGGPAGRGDARRTQAGRGASDAAAKRPWYEVASPGGSAASMGRQAAELSRPARHARPDGRPAARDRYVAPHAPDEPYHGDGRRHCGSLERVLRRQWDAAVWPPAEIVRAIDRLAELPAALKEKLAAVLDGIFVGPGGVPDLDDMQHLRGVPLPAGRATWDVCAGAYGGRKIVVGAQPSPTPDVMCHEIGHALDDTGTSGQWLSDQAEFRRLYDQCVPYLVSDFHRQPSGLGRREFFADAFAAIASGQRPALVDMLGGDTRTALNVMLYFNLRFGI